MSAAGPARALARGFAAGVRKGRHPVTPERMAALADETDRLGQVVELHELLYLGLVEAINEVPGVLEVLVQVFTDRSRRLTPERWPDGQVAGTWVVDQVARAPYDLAPLLESRLNVLLSEAGMAPVKVVSHA